MKTFLVSTLLTALLCGCGKSDSPTQVQNAAPENPPPIATPQVLAVKKPFSIKGFYIGMPLDDARKVASEKVAEIGVTNPDIYKTGDHTFEIGAPSANPTGLEVEGHYTDPLIGIVADRYDTVKSVSFGSTFVNNSFNVKDLNAEAFATQFRENYDIPEMDPYFTGEGYFYIDANDGFEVRLKEVVGQFTRRKSLSLLAVPKRSSPQHVNTPFSIEGFYVGMPLLEARQLAAANVATIGLTNRNLDSVITLRNGRDDHINAVIFAPIYVNSRWFSGDVSEFAKEIIEYYGIPTMDPLPTGVGYSYKDLDAGFEVRIETAGDRHVLNLYRRLSLIQIPKSVERHFEK